MSGCATPSLWILLLLLVTSALLPGPPSSASQEESGSSTVTGALDSKAQFCQEVPLADVNKAIDLYAKLVHGRGDTSVEARTHAAAIAAHHSVRGQLEEAKEWYGRAVQGVETPPRNKSEAAAYHGLGWILGRTGHAAEAVQYLSLAASAWRRLLGPGSACEGIARERLANCLLLSGQNEEALSEYTQAMCILAESLGGDSPPYLRSCHGFANALALQGRLEEALPYYLLVSEARHRLQAPDDPLLAWICHDLALALHGLGRVLDAQPLYREAMEIREGRLPDLHRQSATGLAACLTDRGDLLGARQVLEQILRSYDAETEPDLHREAVTLQSMASLRLRMQDYDAAHDLYQTLFSTFGDSLGRYPRLEGEVLSGLSQIARHDGDTSLAEKQQLRVIAVREALYGAESVFVYTAKGELAGILSEGGRTQEAESLFKHALSQLAAHRGEAGLAYGDISEDYALMLQKHGRTSEAEAWADTMLSAVATTLPAGHLKRIRAYEVASQLHLATAHFQRAWEEALISESEGRRLFLLNIRGMAESSALLYKQTAPRGLPVLLSLLEEARGPSPEMIQTVWESLMESRSAINNELASRRRAAKTAQTLALWNTICAERQQLGNLYVQGPPASAEQTYFQTISDLERHVERLEEQFALLVPAPEGRTPPTLPSLQEALPKHSAVVAMIGYQNAFAEDPERSYGAFVLRSGDDSPHFVPLCSAEALHDLVARLEEHMAGAASLLRLDPSGTETEYRMIGTDLRRGIWDPLGDILSGLNAVYLIPDGDVWRINFSALPADAGGYLAESTPAIRIIGSEGDLLTKQGADPRPGILVLGGVDFDSCGEGAETPELRTPFPAPFVSLPGSQQEAQIVADIWTRSVRPADDPVIELLGGRARERDVRYFGEQVGVIHLATHGFLPRTNAGSEPLDWSQWAGIALAGANRGGCSNEEDGILTASELSLLHLDAARLVFLSSCGSGLGALAPTEGIVGFQRSLRVAGCQAMVLSLWDVPDRPGSEWVERFYTHYTTSGCAAIAHRITCTETLSVRRSLGRSTHPLYWGGFVVIGAVD